MGRLAEASTATICRRLSRIEELTLPASLTRDCGRPSPDEVEAHLNALLARDASIFLERYGGQLRQDELDLFEHLSDDYEVGFYLQKFRNVSTVGTRTTAVKNRRLAHMMKLMDEGQFFGDEAMRERDPFLFQQYIGNYNRPVANSRTLSETLMQNADEMELQARLSAAEEREAQCMEEEESEDEPAEPPAEDPLDPKNDAQFMRSEFETIMKERFLMGKDVDYVDYSAIDNDAGLDDVLLEIENRDREDQYFDQD